MELLIQLFQTWKKTVVNGHVQFVVKVLAQTVNSTLIVNDG